jgi:hypothetical protein
VDVQDVRKWLDDYLTEFAAQGRGDTDDVSRMLSYYGVPFLVSTDAGTSMLTDESQVLAMAQDQVDGMRAARYDHTEQLDPQTVVLNGSCARHHATFARMRSDGSEISRPELTYLVNDRPEGRRISALVVHSSEPAQ